MEKIKVISLEPKEIEIEVEDLTYVQKHYIEVIEDYKRKFNKVPTTREITYIIKGKYQPGSTGNMLKVLKEKGYDYKKMIYSEVEDK